MANPGGILFFGINLLISPTFLSELQDIERKYNSGGDIKQERIVFFGKVLKMLGLSDY
jgi:hypothetical protein